MGIDRIYSRGDQKHKISRRRWLSALGVGGAAALAGCSSGGGDSTPTSTPTETEGEALGTETTETEVSELPEVSGTYNTVRSSSAETLNPLYNSEAGAGTIIGYTLDGGYGFRPGTQFFPQIYDLSSDDSQVWVGTIREGLQFGDPYGEVTAEDMVYQITEVQQSDWATTADSSNFGPDVNVVQNSEYEFQIELPNVNQLYPESYDPLLYPIPKDLMQPYVEEQDDEGMKQDEELNNLEFTGNLGAYSLDTWERESRVVLSRNEDYYMQEAAEVPEIFGNAPYFESLESQVVQEESSRLAALETGETDSAAVPPNRVQEFRELDGVTVYEVPQPFNEVNTYNMRANGWTAGPGNLFRSTRMRQGLGCAVDKEKLVRGVYRGFANVEFTWQPRWSKWYPGDDAIDQYGVGELYGKEATQSRIKEAIDNSQYDYTYDGDRLVNPSGDQVTLTIYHSAGQNTEKAFAEFIAQEFERNAGIVVEVNAINGAQFARNYAQQEDPEGETEWDQGAFNRGPRDVATSSEDWDMSVVYGLNTYPLNPTTAEVFFPEDGFFNYYGYAPDWDARGLFQEAGEATSDEGFQSAVTEIFQNIARDQPMGMYAFPADTPGYSSDIVGPAENFFSGWDFPAWHREG